MPTPMSGPPQGPRMGENCPLQGEHSFQKTALTQFSLLFFTPNSHLKNYFLHVITEKKKRGYIDTLYGSKTWVRLNISYTISVHHNGIIITSITAVTRSPQTKSITGQSVIQDRSKLVKDVLGKFYDVFDNYNYNDNDNYNDIIYVDLPASRTEWSDLSRLLSALDARGLLALLKNHNQYSNDMTSMRHTVKDQRTLF